MSSEERIDENPKCTICAEWLLRINALSHRIESWEGKVESTILF